MDLKTYFKSEFSVCGPLIRELMSFFAGEKEQALLASSLSNAQCPVCGGPAVISIDDTCVSASCSFDHSHLALRSKSQSKLLATLEWGIQRRIVFSKTWKNPWVDPERWSSRLKRTNLSASDGVSYYISLIAELKVHQHLWAAHKRTPEYKQLSDADRICVESVGFLTKMLKQEIVEQLNRSPLFTSLQEYSDVMLEHESAVATARFSSWHKFSQELTDEYRKEVWSVLNELKR